ncbi:hypothetical protein [Chryseobacterium sp. AG844]|uniref:hypothetical protein n=1 Tax=Chryseobacterium sp. AG844 TaxID=2183998 RepID=UPI000D70B157|nr:hypothetical protein [Chryseobacterium sp. AG844]PWW20605.1 hypothetical protein DEU40_11327 [Chryseobacterium sp. AG844]
MKKIMLLLSVIFGGMMYSQVGINTATPTRTLDVNGNVRFRSVDVVTNSDNSGILLTDTAGNVSQISSSDFFSTLKIPSNAFNAEQNTNISTNLSGNSTYHNVVFGTVNLNVAGNGIWNAANNTYTVAKAGVYSISTGVQLSNTLNSAVTYGFYVHAGSQRWGFSGMSQAGNIMVFSGTYVKLLSPGDVIYCETITTGPSSYRQDVSFLHIMFTPL